MLFISTILFVWRHNYFRHSRIPQQNKSFNTTSERKLIASADKHHVDAVNGLQKVKRLYSLERRLLM